MSIDAPVVLLPLLALFASAEAFAYVRSPLPAPEKRRRALVHGVAGAYVAWILSMTLFPVLVGVPADGGLAARLSLVPFADIGGYVRAGEVGRFVHEEIGNIVVFVPSGILLPLLWRRLDGWRGVLAGTAAFSFGIELTQLIEMGRRFASVDDLMLNTLGGASGFALLLAYRAFRGRSLRQPRE